MAKLKIDPDVDVFRTTDKHNRHDATGGECLNPIPMQPPIGYKPTLSLAEQIRQQVRALSLANMEPETEEEADDFEVADDPIIQSRWENDLVPSIKETRARLRELEAQERAYADAQAAQARAAEVPDPRARPTATATP